MLSALLSFFIIYMSADLVQYAEQQGITKSGGVVSCCIGQLLLPNFGNS